MKNAVAYIRPEIGQSDTDLAAQEQAVAAHFEAKLKPLGFAFVGVYRDPEYAGNVPLRERKAGRALNHALARGDHVIVPKLFSAFSSPHDFVSTLDIWTGRGIGVSALDLAGGLTTLTPEGREAMRILAGFAKLEKSFWSERVHRGLRTRKERGKLASGRTKLGTKLAGRAGHKYVVADEEERAVMMKIVAWRNQGCTWSEIYSHLWTHGIRRRDGRDWSEGAVVRAFKAGCQLLAEEARAEPPPGPVGA